MATRRDVLRGAGLLALAAALKSTPSAADAPISSRILFVRSRTPIGADVLTAAWHGAGVPSHGRRLLVVAQGHTAPRTGVVPIEPSALLALDVDRLAAIVYTSGIPTAIVGAARPDPRPRPGDIEPKLLALLARLGPDHDCVAEVRPDETGEEDRVSSIRAGPCCGR